MPGNQWRVLCRRVGRSLGRAALLPLAPLLGWGPFTHIAASRLAWRRVQDATAAVANDLPERLRGEEDTFARASASADAISTHHVLKRCPLYDYMHNWMPDHARGVPRFGYALVQQCLHGPARELAVACGWLAHQMADWWAHYAPIGPDGNPLEEGSATPAFFSGYANSFRVMGVDFHPEILEHYRVLDHALLELLYDLMVLYGNGETLRAERPALFAPGRDNPLTRTSEWWAARLPRVPPRAVEEMDRDFTRVMRGLVTLYSLLGPFRPLLQERADHLIAYREVGESYLERCADKIVQGVFGVSGEEMAQWASPDVVVPPGSPPYAVRAWPLTRAPYPGTPLLDLAGWLGNLEQEVDSSFLLRLAELARGEPAGPRTVGLALLLALTAQPEGGQLPEWLYRLVPPVVSLPGTPSAQVENRLVEAIRSRELVVAFVPATRGDADPCSDPKALDPASLRLSFNGYDVDQYPQYFHVEKHCQEGKIIWYCRLLQPVDDGYHQIWATGRDRSGVTTLPFHYVLNLDPWASPRRQERMASDPERLPH
ncbi:MAG: hypothetical protein QME93_04540 [Bacillota bacterium]|nr:hypothetical protein [Bacillota bacterium]MDI7249318.1 hypothetical protein [Bacillota bacterium]